MLCTQR